MISVLSAATLTIAAFGASSGESAGLPPSGHGPAALVLAAAGDAMLDRGVASSLARMGEGWAFSGSANDLSSADIAFLNLETSVSARGARLAGKGIWFRTSPERLGLLADAGIDVVSVANNHIMDYGEEALLDTLSHLDEHGISYVGAGPGLKEARMGRILEVNGLKVGFLAYSDFHDIFWSVFERKTFGAGEGKPGIAPALPYYMEEDIKRLKRTADFVIVSVHWGVEYSPMPDGAQIARAHAAIDAGADVVLGHHPHVLQPFEAYEGGLVFYSLGNFVFDQRKPRTVESMVAMICLAKGRRPEAEVIPYVISDSRPAPMAVRDGTALMEDLAKRSRLLGTRVEVQGGRAYFTTDGSKASSLLRRMYPDLFGTGTLASEEAEGLIWASPRRSSVP